jgi:hypothetical protein
MINCDCPRCSSKNTKALSVLHHDGDRRSTYRRDGLFYYRGSVGLHASTTRGRSQSLTAQQAALPQPIRLSAVAVAIILFVGALLGGATGFWTALALLFAFAVLIGGSTRERERAFHQWSSSFRCNRCGTVFAVVEDAPASDRALDQGP